MSNRERAILVLMSIAVLYGAYTFFLASSEKASPHGTGKEKEELSRLMAELDQNLAKGALSKTDAYIIARAEEKWQADPFHENKFSAAKTSAKTPAEEAKAPQKIPLDYSGYMEMGKRKLAIINGMEYQVGDELEPGGYFLRGISRTRVLVEVKEKQLRVAIPIVEEIL